MYTDPVAEIHTPEAVVGEHWARLHPRGMREVALTLEHDLGSPEIRIHHVVTSGDLVSVHLDLVGTHTGSASPLLSAVPVTGKPLVWTFMHLFRVAHAMIAEHWACRDDRGLLVQLGASPASTQ